MKKIFSILILTVLFGCITQEQHNSLPVYNVPENNSTNTPNQSAQNYTPPEQQTCEDYCYSAVAPACNGNWSITGSYPNCNCHFDCIVYVSNESENNTEPIDLPEANFSEILDNALDKVSNDFYLEHSGTFTENKYSWERMKTDGTLVDTSTPEVKFNGVSFDSLQSSGYLIFHGDSSKDVYGVAIFNEEDPFAEHGINDGFDVIYIPKTIKRTLLDCQVYNKEYSSNELSVTYFFQCENEKN